MTGMWWWVAGLAWAGTPVTLEQAWERADTAPEAALAAVEEAMGRAERLEAAAFDNPGLEYKGFGRVRGTPDAINGQQHEAELGIRLPLTGEYAARLRRGRLAEALGSARASTRRAVLAEAVGLAWLDLLAAQEREAVVQAAGARLEDLVEMTRRRAEEGAARRWDVQRIALAATTTARQLALLRQERMLAAARLAAVLGDGGAELEAAGSLDRSIAEVVAHVEPTVAPFVAEAERAVAHREQAAREARRSRVPDPELRMGGLWTTDPDSGSVLAGLSWELPVFDRGQGRVAGAAAELASAEGELRRTVAEVTSEVEALRRSLASLEGAAARDVVPEGGFVEAAEVAWREGETGVLELVDAVAAEVEVRLDAVEVRRALRATELRLALLEGRLGPRP